MSDLDTATVAQWREAIGRVERRRQTLDVESLRRFALATDAHPDVERHAPPLAHWAYFLPEPTDATLGEDGHPARGDFLPAITLPRRMFAASAIRFAAPLLLGREAELTSTIFDISRKIGRSGDLAFVEVDRVLTQNGTERVRERQSYVYRGATARMAMPEPAADTPTGETWQPTATHLFRFSAATFNAHRIHYDAPYAHDVEGYPERVVHGPFTAAKLAGLAMRDGPLTRFDFRALMPLFLGQPIVLRTEGADGVDAIRCDGVVAMTAKVSRR